MSKSKKSHYRKSTPVVRLHRNVVKLEKNSELVSDRLKSWQASSDPNLLEALEVIKDVRRDISKLNEMVEALEQSGFIPPKRSSAVLYEPGNTVSVLPKHRGKYEEAFEKVLKEDPGLLNALTVVKILPSGEVVVQRGQRTPFMVRKTHLAPI
jgi:hypothetical protein